MLPYEISDIQSSYLTNQLGLLLVILAILVKLREIKVALALFTYLMTMVSYIPNLNSVPCNSTSNQWSPTLTTRMTYWLATVRKDVGLNFPKICVTEAFQDVEYNNPSWRIKTLNRSSCHEVSQYSTVYDVFKAVTGEVVERGCQRCCIGIDHEEGVWRGEFMLTTDGSDPYRMDCSGAKAAYICKSNKKSLPSCHTTSIHDELRLLSS